MRSLQQFRQVKALLLLLLIMSPVDLESRLRFDRPHWTRKLLRGRATRAPAVCGDAITSNATAATSSTGVTEFGPIVKHVSYSATFAASRGGRPQRSDAIRCGIIGAAADFSQSFQWGGTGEFAGESGSTKDPLVAWHACTYLPTGVLARDQHLKSLFTDADICVHSQQL
jgi:hypothetical protein